MRFKGCAAQEFRLASKLTDTMGKPANQPFSLHMCIVACEQPPVIVGLETAVEMNLVQIGTNEFFPNSPLLNSRQSSTTTQEIERILLCYVHE
jgi:hypothetical protein